MTSPVESVESSTDIAETLKERVSAALREHQDDLVTLSRQLHADPEVGYQEYKSSRLLAERAGCVPGARVTIGLDALPTAFKAEAGDGELTITICAEYDALPGVGHACGHNLIAASSLGAFLALSGVADELGITVRLLGTPAEESDGGKADMLRQGDFDGTHAAMMVHPGNTDEVIANPLSCVNYRVTFTGQSAHASAEPWSGRNALDAMTIALTAIGLARQQLRPDQQIHGMLDGAGSAPNVIPDSASGLWTIRAASVESLHEVADTLQRCCEAGALATRTEVSVIREGNVFADMRTDDVMAALFQAAGERLGRCLLATPSTLKGSTDMGNVSQFYPSIHPMLSVGTGAPPIHSPQFAEFTIGAGAEQELMDAATAMAHMVVDLVTDQEQRARLLSHTPGPRDRAGLELDDRG